MPGLTPLDPKSGFIPQYGTSITSGATGPVIPELGEYVEEREVFMGNKRAHMTSGYSGASADRADFCCHRTKPRSQAERQDRIRRS